MGQRSIFCNFVLSSEQFFSSKSQIYAQNLLEDPCFFFIFFLAACSSLAGFGLYPVLIFLLLFGPFLLLSTISVGRRELESDFFNWIALQIELFADAKYSNLTTRDEFF